jgi:hypothetical protein
MEKFGPIRNDVDFFSAKKGQPIFYDLTAKLTATGIRFKDVTGWRRQRQVISPPQPTEQGGLVQSPETPSTETEKQGRFSSMASGFSGMVSGVLDMIAGPDLSSLQPQPSIVQDPYDHIVFVYRRGCTLVEHYHQGMAQGQLARVRQAITIHVTGLLRDLRTYTNEQVMETGRLVRDVGQV